MLFESNVYMSNGPCSQLLMPSPTWPTDEQQGTTRMVRSTTSDDDLLLAGSFHVPSHAVPWRRGSHADDIDAFLELLPKDVASAEALATAHHNAQHLQRKGGACLVWAGSGGGKGNGGGGGGGGGPAAAGSSSSRPLRHAVEVRHASFGCARFYETLARHNIAMVLADTAGEGTGSREARLCMDRRLLFVPARRRPVRRRGRGKRPLAA